MRCADSTNGYAPWCVSAANTPKAKRVSPTNRRQSMPRRSLRPPVSPLLGLGMRPPVSLLVKHPLRLEFRAEMHQTPPCRHYKSTHYPAVDADISGRLMTVLVLRG